MLAMRAIMLNFMLKLSMRQPITEQVSRELIEWTNSNKTKRAFEILAKNSTREERMQTRPQPLQHLRVPLSQDTELPPKSQVIQQ
jgi:hypothetical protein